MRERWIVPVGFLVLISVAVACDRAGSPGSTASREAEAPPSRGSVVLAASVAAEAERRIQTATLSVEVVDLTAAERRVISEAEALGGYLQDRRASGEDDDRRSSIVLRVPADRFNEAVAAAEELGRVLEASSQTEDVSQAYADLETRLRVKRGVEARLRGILESRTGKLSEVLEVENELARVVEEVERIEAGLQVYDRRIAWSTVKLELRQRAAEVVEAAFLPRLKDAFLAGSATFRAAVTGTAYLLGFLAPWLVTAAFVFWGVLRIRRTVGENVP